MSEGIRFRQSGEDKAKQLLIQQGHLKQEEVITQALREDLASGAIDISDVVAISNEIEEAKNRGISDKGLPLSAFQDALRYGFRNLAGIGFHRALAEEDLSSFDLRSADFRGAEFFRCNFGDANLDNMHFGLPAGDLERPIKVEELKENTVDFPESNLNDITLQTLSISEQVVDLIKDAVQVNGYWDISTNEGNVGSCAGAEMYFKAVLEMPDKRAALDTGYAKYAKRGVVIFQGGEPLGIYKLKNERSFLPLRTVRNEIGQTIFWKGMIYAFETTLRDTLNNLSRPYEDASVWRRADIEIIAEEVGRSFKRDNMRFLYDPRMYDRLSEVREEIRSGKEKVLDIVSGKLV